MKIEIFGGGVIGSVAASMFLKLGYQVYFSEEDTFSEMHYEKDDFLSYTITAVDIELLKKLALWDEVMQSSTPLSERVVPFCRKERIFPFDKNKTKALYFISRESFLKILDKKLFEHDLCRLE